MCDLTESQSNLTYKVNSFNLRLNYKTKIPPPKKILCQMLLQKLNPVSHRLKPKSSNVKVQKSNPYKITLFPENNNKFILDKLLPALCKTVGTIKWSNAVVKKYVPKTKSYVRDTQHFISRLKQLGHIPENAILVTLDVSSLYTNIPNHEGMLAVAEHLRSDPEKQQIGPHILKLLKLVLHSMSFTFNGDHYLQIGGTAMGTATAPNYANLFMDRFETKALANWPLKPLIWLRFIDDIFIIWTHGEDKLDEFITYLNSIHPTIKFTHESSTTQINFLDTTVKIIVYLGFYVAFNTVQVISRRVVGRAEETST